MAAAELLTDGAITKMRNENIPKEDGWKPVVQVTEVRMLTCLPSQDDPLHKERFVIRLSDGCLRQQGILGAQLNPLVNQGKLRKGSVIRLTEFFCSPVKGRLYASLFLFFSLFASDYIAIFLVPVIFFFFFFHFFALHFLVL